MTLMRLRFSKIHSQTQPANLLQMNYTLPYHHLQMNLQMPTVLHSTLLKILKDRADKEDRRIFMFHIGRLIIPFVCLVIAHVTFTLS